MEIHQGWGHPDAWRKASPKVSFSLWFINLELEFWLKHNCYVGDDIIRLVGACWRPVFSTSHHGFSLRSLYRKFQVFAKCPSAANPGFLVVLLSYLLGWMRPRPSGDWRHWWLSFWSTSLQPNQVLALLLLLLSFAILCRESEHFYGTGESFLFTCQPRWNFYSWAGDNQVLLLL